MGKLSRLSQAFGGQKAAGGPVARAASALGITPPSAPDSQTANYYGGGVLSNPLPRPPEIYTAGTFAPGNPISPFPAQAPPDGSERPLARRRQYPVNINYPVGSPGSEMGQRKLSFQTMRQWYNDYNPVSACVDLRVTELLSMGLEIQPTKLAMRAIHTDRAARQDFEDRRQKAMTFFRKPDPNFDSWHSWAKVAYQDLFIVDGACWQLWKARGKGKGVLGSDLAALAYIAPDTIKPILGILGEVPLPPNVAYQQYIWGVPRAEFMRPIDEEEEGGLAREYGSDQLKYMMLYPQTNTIYGMSGIEKAIVPIMSGLKYQEHQLNWFTQGAIPDTFMVVGDPEMPPTLRNDLENALNQTGADLGNKVKIRVLPADTKVIPMREIALANVDFLAVLYEQLLMNYQIDPQELHLTTSKSSGKGGISMGNEAGEKNKADTKRRSLVEITDKIKMDFYDHILHDILGQEDMEMVFPGLVDEEDFANKAAVFINLVDAGIWHRNEARLETGKDPDPTPEASMLMITAGSTVLPLAGSSTSPDLPPEAPHPVAPPDTASEQAQDSTTDAQIAQSDSNQIDVTDQAVKARQKVDTKTRHQLAELTKLRSSLKRGKDAKAWVGKALDQKTVDRVAERIANGEPYEQAVRKARKGVLAGSHKMAREKVTGPIEAAIAVSLAKGLKKVQSGSQTPTQFADASVTNLRKHYQTAADAGSAQARDDWGDTDATMDVSPDPDDAADKQHPYLVGLAGAVVAAADNEDPESSADPIADEERLASYGSPATTLYEQGYASETPEGYSIGWVSEADGNVCSDCDARDGEEYDLDSLPNWPGDGDFGGDPQCGPGCRCTLVFTSSEMGGDSVSSQYESTDQ